MMMHTKHNLTRRAGFTLIEVLIAIGIFAIGMVAVASIFPVAILLQKQTVEEVEATNFGRNVRAIVAAKGFEATNWSSVANNGSGRVSKIEGVPGDPLADWSLIDRSYNTLEPVDQRRVFWVPLCYDTNPDTGHAWQLYVFVVRNARDTTYDTGGNANDIANDNDQPYVPRVRRMTVNVTGGNRMEFPSPGDNAPRVIRPGEDIIDEFGVDYRVTEADDDGFNVKGNIPGSGALNIWYASPANAGDTSTFVRLIRLPDDPEGEVNDMFRTNP